MKTKNITTVQTPIYGGIIVEFDNDKISKEKQDKIIRELQPDRIEFWLSQVGSEQPTTLLDGGKKQ